MLFKVPFIIRAPLVEGSYQSCGENAVLIGGAWALYVSKSKHRKSRGLGMLAGVAGLRAAYVIYGLALIAFGLSHFVYLSLTAPLVPAWLPTPVFWAYSTGAVYLVAGGGVGTGQLGN